MARDTTLLKHLPKALFILSLLFLSFFYGITTIKFKIFPYQILNEAYISYRALVETTQSTKKIENMKEEHINLAFVDDEELQKPTARNHSQSDGGELFLILGGPDQLKSYCPANGCIAWLIDRKGVVKHTWNYDLNLWKGMDKVTGFNMQIYPRSAHLYDNGDLLVTYQAYNAWPYGIGMAKFDKDSNLLWKKEEFNHHSVSVAGDGAIYTPSMNLIDSPYNIGRTSSEISCKTKTFYEDTIMVADSDGNIHKELSTMEVLLNSGYVGIFNDIHNEAGKYFDSCDPLHLNDVQILKANDAAAYPGLNAGDLLLSFRNLNTIAVMDANTQTIKWISTGLTIHQHSPRFGGHNDIFILDNLGGDRQYGVTRIVRIDMETKNPEVVFPRDSNPPPFKVSTAEAGYLDIHREGKKLLLSESYQGKVLEVDIETGQVLWEYINTHPVEDKFGRFHVLLAKYVYNKSFTFNQ